MVVDCKINFGWERTAVPADPPWPRVVESQCSWCGDPESAHEGGVREHHRIELVGGRYEDEPEILGLPGLPAPVDPEVDRTVLAAVRAGDALLDALDDPRHQDNLYLMAALRAYRDEVAAERAGSLGDTGGTALPAGIPAP